MMKVRFTFKCIISHKKGFEQDFLWQLKNPTVMRFFEVLENLMILRNPVKTGFFAKKRRTRRVRQNEKIFLKFS